MKQSSLLPAAILALSIAACSRTAPQSATVQSPLPVTAQSTAAPAAPASVDERRAQESGVVGAIAGDSTASPIQPAAGAGTSRPRFKDADSDHDGRLSRTEAQVLPNVASHFDAIDADHDGYVTRPELRAAHDRMQAARNARVAARPPTQQQPNQGMH